MTKSRRTMLRLAMAFALAGCSTLGTGPGQPEGLPHGGTGPFRLLTADEVDVPGVPAGQTLFDRSHAVEGGMVASGHLFYTGALVPPPSRDAGMLDPDAGPPGDAGMLDPDAGFSGDAGVLALDAGTSPDAPRLPVPAWSAFAARGILRSPPRANGQRGFDEGTPALTATAEWEGGHVEDPWTVVDDDGHARLYYAAAGGIGLAEAPTVGGTFVSAGAPVIEGEGVRRPSVVRGLDDAGFLMLFERGGRIERAHSSDGRTWTQDGPVTLPALAARDERDDTEVSVGSPGVVRARTSAGRTVLRMYYESRRGDGQVLIAMAGSFDGVSFETLEVPVVESRSLRMPAPLSQDERITLLYMSTARGGTPERGALVVGVAPGRITLP